MPFYYDEDGLKQRVVSPPSEPLPPPPGDGDYLSPLDPGSDERDFGGIAPHSGGHRGPSEYFDTGDPSTVNTYTNDPADSTPWVNPELQNNSYSALELRALAGVVDGQFGFEEVVDVDDSEEDSGKDGSDGRDGSTGATGARGPTGGRGGDGQRGATGSAGKTGSDGARGDTGATGSEGAQGPPGPVGRTGLPGRDGQIGARGPVGPVGPQGVSGPGGEPGERGNPGPSGSDGEIGPIGPDGRQGDQGLRGRPGQDGEDGVDGEDGDDGSDGRDFGGNAPPPHPEPEDPIVPAAPVVNVTVEQSAAEKYIGTGALELTESTRTFIMNAWDHSGADDLSKWVGEKIVAPSVLALIDHQDEEGWRPIRNYLIDMEGDYSVEKAGEEWGEMLPVGAAIALMSVLAAAGLGGAILSTVGKVVLGAVAGGIGGAAAVAGRRGAQAVIPTPSIPEVPRVIDKEVISSDHAKADDSASVGGSSGLDCILLIKNHLATHGESNWHLLPPECLAYLIASGLTRENNQ